MNSEEWADSVRDRLMDALKSARKTQRELSKYLGVTESAVSQWMNRTSEPDWFTLYRISMFLGVSIDRLFGCPGSPVPIIEIDSEEFVTLPISLRAAAGSPIFEPVDLEGRRLAFRRDWLRRAAGMLEIDEKCCYLAKVDGNSMEPTLADGAVVLVVRWYPPTRGSKEPIIQNGTIYLIQGNDDGRAVKRLTLDENRKQLLVTSDNPTYPPYTIPLEDRDLRHIILGRVIWSATAYEQEPVITAQYSEEFGCVMGSITGPVTVQESRQFLNQARSVADAHPLCRRILADCRRAEPYVRTSDASDLASLIESTGFKDWRGAILFSPDRLLIECVANAVADCGYTLKPFTDYFEALSWLREGDRSSQP